jgi:hypothetical protein
METIQVRRRIVQLFEINKKKYIFGRVPQFWHETCSLLNQLGIATLGRARFPLLKPEKRLAEASPATGQWVSFLMPSFSPITAKSQVKGGFYE